MVLMFLSFRSEANRSFCAASLVDSAQVNEWLLFRGFFDADHREPVFFPLSFFLFLLLKENSTWKPLFIARRRSVLQFLERFSRRCEKRLEVEHVAEGGF